MELILLVLYFGGMLWIGYGYSSKQTSVSEFVTADHGLGYWVATFSARTTGESGWLLLGLTGAGFATGLTAFWVVAGEVVGVAVSWLFLVPVFKKEVNKLNCLTMLDFFEGKLGDKRHYLRFALTTVLLLMVTVYTAAQLTATGKAFNQFYGLDRHLAEVIGVVVILGYVTMGGFRAVAMSDFIQGILMAIGLIVVPIVAVIYAGGPGPLFDHVGSNFPDLMNVFPAGENGFIVFLAVLGLAGPGLGFLGSPQVYQRMIALKPDTNLKRATGVAILYTFLTDAGAVMCGIAGRYFFDQLADPESVYPLLTRELFPAIMVGLFVAIILSAIMSTADSLLILAATTLVRDVYQKVFRPDLSEQRAVFLLRIACVVMGLIALLIAATEVRQIFWFALFGWAGIACAFCPAMIMTLFWKRTNTAGALAGVIAGFSTTILWKVFSERFIEGVYIYEMVPGFVVAFIAIWLVSLITSKK